LPPSWGSSRMEVLCGSSSTRSCVGHPHGCGRSLLRTLASYDCHAAVDGSSIGVVRPHVRVVRIMIPVCGSSTSSIGQRSCFNAMCSGERALTGKCLPPQLDQSSPVSVWGSWGSSMKTSRCGIGLICRAGRSRSFVMWVIHIDR
jgi:hypothetical protein